MNIVRDFQMKARRVIDKKYDEGDERYDEIMDEAIATKEEADAHTVQAAALMEKHAALMAKHDANKKEADAHTEQAAALMEKHAALMAKYGALVEEAETARKVFYDEARRLEKDNNKFVESLTNEANDFRAFSLGAPSVESDSAEQESPGGAVVVEEESVAGVVSQ